MSSSTIGDESLLYDHVRDGVLKTYWKLFSINFVLHDVFLVVMFSIIMTETTCELIVFIKVTKGSFLLA